MSPFFEDMGITRVANVTGLDNIGIPVVMVVRPRAKSLAVSQGKGTTLASAKVSGVMESIELFHAEHIRLPKITATYDQLQGRELVVDPSQLPKRRNAQADPRRSIEWIEGNELFSDQPIWVPYETVHLDLESDESIHGDWFLQRSNGLASGNTITEAQCHALSEVIERDAEALWQLSTPAHKQDTRINLETVDDPSCRALVEQFREAGVAVGVWDTTSDIGIASFRCMIVNESDAVDHLYSAEGAGTHPSRHIALSRALTEAAQSRLTAISGARDDIYRDKYKETSTAKAVLGQRLVLSLTLAQRDFTSVPTFESESLVTDLRHLLDRLAAVGINQAASVDLTLPEFGIPVVKVIVPELEESFEHPGFTVGKRASALVWRASA